VTAHPKYDPLSRYLDGVMGDRLTKANQRTARARASDQDPLLLRGKDHEGDRVSQMRPSAVLHRRARLSAPAVLKRPQNQSDGGRLKATGKGGS
jgi:hypothetical protein